LRNFWEESNKVRGLAIFPMNIIELTTKVAHNNSAIIQSFPMVTVAVSGGVDSTALLHVFCQLLKKNKIKELSVLHVNFGLRGDESDGDQRFVGDLCAELGVECHAVKAPPCPDAGSVQVWARDFRHEFFKKEIERGRLVAVAHHQDDVAENAIFRLIRGTHPDKLAGMSTLDGGLWRPFFSCSKKEIQIAMEKSNCSWRDDSSNATGDYTRNVIRNEILPVFERLAPGSKERIAQFAIELSAHAMTRDEAFPLRKIPNLSREKVGAIEDFFSHADTGQKIDLGDGFSLVKSRPLWTDGKSQVESLEHKKHMACLDAVQMSLILPRSSLVLTRPRAADFAAAASEELWNVPEAKLDRNDAVILSIATPSPDDRVENAEQGGAFKFKDLMQKWNVPAIERARYALMRIGGGEQRVLRKLF
jgi:tRNA(Ile)-lysidine synthetase-like protein